MSPDIIKFEKSFEQRLDEYQDILGLRGALPASEVKNEWIYYIENVIEAGGWQAVWKISRQKCDEFNIEFPTVVLVMVKCVIFQELKAEVDIMAVQDDISLPEEHEVPLMNLYPTKQQDYSDIDITNTANCLDQFRFFYSNLWQPWDCDDENEDWLESHLEARLKLVYDLKSGSVLHETGHHIRSLLQEARGIEQQIQDIKDRSVDDNEDRVEESSMLKMMELQLRREEIKREVEILENPEVRDLMVKKKQKVAKEKKQSSESAQEVCFVWLGGTINELIHTLTQVKNFVHPDTYIKTSSLLQEALDQAVAGDTVIVCPGVHGVCSTGGLEEGGSIKGFLGPSDTTLVSHDARNVFLDWSGYVTIENMTIDVAQVQIALSVRQGKVRLFNCQITGTGSTGVLVLRDGSLEVVHCLFSGCFGIGIVLDSKAHASLTDCSITSSKIGLKLSEEASLKLEKCRISQCSEYGIKVEVNRNTSLGNDMRIVGSVALLERFEKIEINEVHIEENKKGDVLVMQKPDDVMYQSGDSGCESPNHESKTEDLCVEVDVMIE